MKRLINSVLIFATPEWTQHRAQSSGVIRKRWSIDKIATFDSNDEEDEFQTKSSKKDSKNYDGHNNEDQCIQIHTHFIQ